MVSPSVDGNEARAKRFLREAKADASLRHPNIISVYDAGEIDGQLYMVMDYVSGIALRKLIADGLSLGSVNRISSDLCQALRAAHHAGFVHRDIKPENVLISTGRVADVTNLKLESEDSSSSIIVLIRRKEKRNQTKTAIDCST